MNNSDSVARKRRTEYLKKRRSIGKQLQNIKMQLAAHDKAQSRNPLNQAYLGDLGLASEKLAEIERFMTAYAY